MTKQELLTKLAMECATWEEAVLAEVEAEIQRGYPLGGPSITVAAWLAERERLLNKPSLADLPVWVKAVAIDETGEWWGYNELAVDALACNVTECFFEYLGVDNDAYWEKLGEAVAIPAGYDWKQSLEARPV